MDDATLVHALAQIDEEISAKERDLEDLRLQRLGAVAFLSRLGVTAPADPPDTGSRGGQPCPVSSRTGQTTGIGNAGVVADLLMQYPNGITLTQIQDTLARGGTPLDSDQVRSAVGYLRRKRQVESVSRGTWRLVPPAPRNAEGSTAATVEPSDHVALAPEGGGFTDDSGSHHDHRNDLGGRDDDRDRVGASIGG